MHWSLSINLLSLYAFKIFASDSAQIFIWSRRRIVTSCCYTAKESHEKETASSRRRWQKYVMTLVVIRCGDIFGMCTRSLRKVLMDECKVKLCVGACMYMFTHTSSPYDLSHVYFASLATDMMQIESRFLSRITSIH